MSINLNNDGTYPIPDDVWPSFDQMWKDELSHIPEAPLKWKDREPYRIFSEKVYENIVRSRASLTNLATTAYEDGYEDGQKNRETDIIEMIDKMTDDYPHIKDFIAQLIDKIKLV